MAYQSPAGGQLVAANTNPAAFPAGTPGTVWLQTPTGNAGTVTITDVAGGAGGLVLPAGIGVTYPIIVIGPLENLASLQVQFSSAGDVLNYLVLR